MSPERVRFWQKVGLSHDLDPAREAGKAARVPQTLERLDLDFAGTRSFFDSTTGSRRFLTTGRYGWNELDLKAAKAAIARTEFPFNHYYKRVDGKIVNDLTGEVLDEAPTGVMVHGNPWYTEHGISPAKNY